MRFICCDAVGHEIQPLLDDVLGQRALGGQSPSAGNRGGKGKGRLYLGYCGKGQRQGKGHSKGRRPKGNGKGEKGKGWQAQSKGKEKGGQGERKTRGRRSRGKAAKKGENSKDVLNKQLATYMERSNSMELDADKTDFVRSNSI